MQPSRLGHLAIVRALGRMSLVLATTILAAPLSTASASASTSGPAVIVKVHQASGLISPYFQLAAAPGSVVRAGSLELVNPTSRTIAVRLDPVDAITASTLGSAYALTNSGMHGPTKWLRLSQRNVTLPPHASKSLSVAAAVPTSAGPGDYLAGVSVEALGQTQTSASGGLAIGEIDRYAIGVELKVPGARHPAIKLTGAAVAREPSGLAFLVTAINSGNVILKNVHGWVRVTVGNRAVASATIQPGTFVSATTISYQLLAHREQPVPGARYRVRAALYYAGGVARLDTRVKFSHAAAVTQQNYGGRKLPKSTPPWRWIALALLALAALLIAAWWLRRRRRPLTRAAALKLLDRALTPGGALPVSIALVTSLRRAIGATAAALRPRLQRTDRIADLGREGVLVICPGTSRPGAVALRRDLNELLARDPDLADLPIEITVSTAVKPTTANTLLGRIQATRRRQAKALGGPAEREAASARGD